MRKIIGAICAYICAFLVSFIAAFVVFVITGDHPRSMSFFVFTLVTFILWRCLREEKEIDWSAVDWTKSNDDIAHELKVPKRAVVRRRALRAQELERHSANHPVR